MAIDSRQKRAAVIGVGRAWYRNPDPNNLDAAQRASIGSVYPVAIFALPDVGSEDLECVVIALITDPGEVVKLAINDVETVVAAGIVEETVVIGIINDSGKVVKTPIDDTEVVVPAEISC